MGQGADLLRGAQSPSKMAESSPNDCRRSIRWCPYSWEKVARRLSGLESLSPLLDSRPFERSPERDHDRPYR